MLWRTLVIATVLREFKTLKSADAQLLSPCPRLFTYEARRDDEPDRWYGIITLLSDSDLKGIWIRVQLSRPSIQLGNWFGSVATKTPTEYRIKNNDFVLKAHIPKTIRIFVQYKVGEEIPMLTGILLNAKTICPEGLAITSSTKSPTLQTSNDLGSPTPEAHQPEIPPQRPSTWRPTAGSAGSSQDGSGITFNEDDYPTSDFHRPGSLQGANVPPIRPAGTNPKPPACGTVAVQPAPLIIYGESTYEGQFPWHAALYISNKTDLTYVCGASLISQRHVLTVAHCVTRKSTSGPMKPSKLNVYLGKYSLSRWSTRGIQDRQVEKIIPHPNYNFSSLSNDIALVKLGKPVLYTDYVRPICLWEESEADLGAVIKKLGTVAGWGFDETGELADKLTQVKMPVVSTETCLRSHGEFFSRFTSDKTYCAGFRNGVSVCNGDSGGGMVFPKAGTNPAVWQLRGMVSLSVLSQAEAKCDPEHYAVFTDVAKYLGWIKGNMKL